MKYVLCLFILLSNTSLYFDALAQEDQGYKTSIDMTMDEVGAVNCEFSTKYNAAAWDNFTRTIGNNTSILKNMLIRTFPKYILSDFNYSQDAGERTNNMKFKIDGMLRINKNGRWMADLEKKDPDITKISDREFLLLFEGNTMKIHLPEGTSDAKIEKDTFGKALLTYPAEETGMTWKILIFLGIALALAGGFLLYRNLKAQKSAPALRTVYETENNYKDLPSTNQTKGITGQTNQSQPALTQQPDIRNQNPPQETNNG